MGTPSISTASAALSWLHVVTPESDRKPDQYWFDDLKQAARDNHTYSIEYLFTLACEASETGRKASAFLFSLYTGKENASPVLSRQLGKDSLRLCEIVFRRNAGKAPDDRWSIPAKILMMAGFEATDESELRSMIVDEINRQEPVFGSYIDDHEVDTSLFEGNRLVTSAELDAVAKQLNVEGHHAYFLDAMRISDEAVQNNSINDALLTALINLTNADARSSSVTAIALLLREHWVLFGMHSTDGDEKSAFVFSSVESLDDAQKNYLSELSQACGSADQRIAYIEENLQEHAPNACGVFVALAMEKIAQDSAVNPTRVLHDYVNDCAALESAEMALFNSHGRARLFGTLIDVAHT